MVTRIRKGFRGHLFLKEHRKAKGVSASAMAGRVGIERESVYRLEREPWRCKPDMQAAWAHALGIEPGALWRLPTATSLDDMVSKAPADVQAMVVDIVKRMVAGG